MKYLLVLFAAFVAVMAVGMAHIHTEAVRANDIEQVRLDAETLSKQKTEFMSRKIGLIDSQSMTLEQYLSLTNVAWVSDEKGESYLSLSNDSDSYQIRKDNGVTEESVGLYLNHRKSLAYALSENNFRIATIIVERRGVIKFL